MREKAPRHAALQAVLPIWQGRRKVVYIAVRGRSMRPLVRETDRVAVRLMAPGELRAGDLFAFRGADGALVVHRHAGWGERGGQRIIWEQGDNAAGFRPVFPDQVLGRVERIERAGGPAVDLLAGPWPWISLALGWAGAREASLAAGARRFEQRSPWLRRAAPAPLRRALRRGAGGAARGRRVLVKGLLALSMKVFRAPGPGRAGRGYG